MSSVEYKQGMTHVFCDYDKTVITNTAGGTYVKDNVEQIFGMGEYHKLMMHKYVEDAPKTIGGTYTLISGYTPDRAREDLKVKEEEKGLPGLSAKDLMEKYEK